MVFARYCAALSKENVETLQSMYEAFNDGDGESALTYLHPEAELHQPSELPDAASYYGLAEFQRGITLWLDEWESFLDSGPAYARIEAARMFAFAADLA